MERQPKIGEIVHYFPGTDEQEEEVKTNGNESGPVAAIVVRNWGKDENALPMVNLTVFPDCGSAVSRTSIHHGSNKLEGSAHWHYPEE